MSTRKKLRVIGKEFCEVEVTLSQIPSSYCPESSESFARLSIVAVHGRKTPTRYVEESFGQLHEEMARFFPEIVPMLKWHLNDMHAECEHQEERGETYATHPNATCPECGYRLGSEWTKRELPADVVAWAQAFGGEESARS